jgi:hypothetical protein
MTSALLSSTPPTALLAAGQAVAPGASQSAQHPKSPRNGGSQSGGAGSGGSSRPRKDDRRKDDRRKDNRRRKSRPPGNASSAANGGQTSSKAPRRLAQTVLAAPPGPPSCSRGPGPSRCGLAPALPRHCLRHRLSGNRRRPCLHSRPRPTPSTRRRRRPWRNTRWPRPPRDSRRSSPGRPATGRLSLRPGGISSPSHQRSAPSP